MVSGEWVLRSRRCCNTVFSFICISIGLPEPPVEGLFSGCAVGIIHKDMQLSELVLNELQKHLHDPRFTHHIAYLTAQFHHTNVRIRSENELVS